MLSVVVTVVDGGAALRRCLTALASQRAPVPDEIIVPWDDTVAGIADLEAAFPTVVFLPMGDIATRRASSTDAAQHELIDRRRSAGLARARGDVIGMLEDRGIPRPDWARQVAAQHARWPYAVIGGAVENGRAALLNRAVYYCDFVRYGLPFEPGLRAYVSDVNVSYKRAALEQIAALWREQYHETTVHWALTRAGEKLYLSDQPVVDQQRDDLSVRGLLQERYAWGRLFAHTRAREHRLSRRAVFALGTPVLPVVLLLRQARRRWASARALTDFVAATPVTLLLLAAWSLGEVVGYITGEA